jgi:hypothetical protein
MIIARIVLASTALLLVVPLSLDLAGCKHGKSSASAVDSYNGNPLTVSIPRELSQEQIEEALAATLMGRTWTVTSRKPAEVVGELTHRGIKGRVILKADRDVVSIINDSYRISEEGDIGVPVVPLGWLRNLQKDMEEHFSRALGPEPPEDA